MRKPIVYIASAYTKGDPAVNANFQCRVFDQLLADGVVTPYAPLWTHYQHSAFPRPYPLWLSYDNEIIDSGVFDACVRLTATAPTMPGYSQFESGGADKEVARFEAQGKPVFKSIEELYAWAQARSQGEQL